MDIQMPARSIASRSSCCDASAIFDASELSTDTAGGAASTMITCWGSAWPERPSPIMTSHERSA
jgi:hypothetical protein